MILLKLILIIIFFEILIRILVKIFKKKFQWIITKEDEKPKVNNIKYEKFFNENFSEDLGWDRKPGTKGEEINNENKTYFQISKEGYRKSVNNFNNSKIATFGDSYAFCRYVSDSQTWQHYLEIACKTHVRNFGIGNYGLDQAFLKFEKQNLEEENKIVIFSIVPETISRIHSYWKHYLEFGNIFSFKPRFILDEKKQIIKLDNFLKKRPMSDEFFENLEKVKKNDFFYENKFKKRIFKSSYLLSFLRFPRLNFFLFYYLLINLFFSKSSENKLKNKFYYKALKVIITQNIIDANGYYLNKDMSLLLKKLIMKYNNLIKGFKKKLIILIIPQKFDLLILKKKNYVDFFKEISSDVDIIDLTDTFIEHYDINSLYIDDKYAGHLSEEGNKLVSEGILKFFKEKNIKW